MEKLNLIDISERQWGHCLVAQRVSQVCITKQRERLGSMVKKNGGGGGRLVI